MTIYWHKIPKCFQYAVMDRDNYGEHDEYELDGTEDWKTSLQERPKD